MIMGGKQRSTQELPADLHAAHIYSNLGISEEKRPFRRPEDISGGFFNVSCLDQGVRHEFGHQRMRRSNQDEESLVLNGLMFKCGELQEVKRLK